jgi:hypothetical protein
MYQFSLEGLSPRDSKPYPFTPEQKEWLSRLRSGKYLQGRGLLKDGAGAYCCLGIMAEVLGAVSVAGPHAVAPCFKMPDEPDLVANQSYLTFRLRVKAGFRSDSGEFAKSVTFPGVNYGKAHFTELHRASHTSLAAMNDCRVLEVGKGLPNRPFSFTEIADYIEFDPWNVFMSPEEIERINAAFNPKPEPVA